MSVTEDTGSKGAKPKSSLPMVLGLVLASSLGAAGFFVAYTGMVPVPGMGSDPAAAVASDPVGDEMARPRAGNLTFVSLPPMVVSIGAPGQSRHLRFQAELEVAVAGADLVRSEMPRILDALNGYLRAVPPEEFEMPAALVKLRAQMLRRMQLVIGGGHVRDLLITEFVIN